MYATEIFEEEICLFFFFEICENAGNLMVSL